VKAPLSVAFALTWRVATHADDGPSEPVPGCVHCRCRPDSQPGGSADDCWESPWVDAVDTAGTVEALVFFDDTGEWAIPRS
jgi:hypothetical protein